MDWNTFDETIQAFKRRKPFRPFTVAMVDGDKLEVDYQEGSMWFAMAPLSMRQSRRRASDIRLRGCESNHRRPCQAGFVLMDGEVDPFLE